jgi:MFS family permease
MRTKGVHMTRSEAAAGPPLLGLVPGATDLQRRSFWAAFWGYALDAFDFLLFAQVIGVLIVQLRMNAAVAGLLSSVSLVAAAVGGLVFGVLTDRLGRRRVLILTVLVYSVASLGAATAQGWPGMLAWRILLGLGMGGEWGAGMALVTETFGVRHRGRVVALIQASWPVGYLGAVLASALVVPALGWRALLAVGILPALVILVVTRRVDDPALWRDQTPRPRLGVRTLAKHLFGRDVVRATMLTSLLAIFGYLGYQAIAIWLPTFLTGPARTGGLAQSPSSATAMLVVFNVGALVCFPLFGMLSDRYGRKPVFILFVLVSLAVTPVAYVWLAHLRPLAPFYLALFVSGGGVAFFGYYGAGVSELFPTRARGTALGFVNNIGRIVGGQAPVVIGAVSEGYGFGDAMALVAVIGFAMTATVALFMPETKGVPLQ